MNERKSLVRIATVGIVMVIGVGLVGESRVFAADPVIHVAWNDGPGPFEDTDYHISTAPPGSVDFPYVALETGSVTWKIWSRDTDNPNGVGDIGIISSPYAANFGVKIEDDSGGAGARVVKGINLDPTNSSNYSSVSAGNITGDLDGNLFVQSSTSGAGGALNFSVDGNVEGNIAAESIISLEIGGNLQGNLATTGTVTYLEIHGDAVGDLTVPYVTSIMKVGGSTYGTIDIGEILGIGSQLVFGSAEATGCTDWSGSSVFGPIDVELVGPSTDLVVRGHLQADLTVDTVHGEVRQWGHVGDNSGFATTDVSITIGALFQPGPPYSQTQARFNVVNANTPSPVCSFHGDLLLTNGVAGNTRVTVYGAIESGASIDLNNADVAGWLRNFSPGGGTILNGGTVTVIGLVILADGFTGTASFATTVAGNGVDEGVIATETDGDWDGTIEVTGAAAGAILVDGDNNGSIEIGGSLAVTGLIAVSEDSPGEISVASDLIGIVTVGGNLSDDISVVGDVTSTGSIEIDGGIVRYGRVLIEGACNGDITIGEGTSATSFIHIDDGFDGSLQTGTAAGSFDVDGDILFGPVATPILLGDYSFDGCVDIDGDLDGDIDVVGCLDLDPPICVQGTTNGTITLTQTDCVPDNYVVDGSCAACP